MFTGNYRQTLEIQKTKAFFHLYFTFFKLIRVFRNFQAVTYDYLFHWGINISLRRVEIPLFILQHGKGKRTHKSNKGKVCWLSCQGMGMNNSYWPENAHIYC